jgi:hypothetical protein
VGNVSRDRIRNTYIRAKLQIGHSSKWRKYATKTKRSRLRWFGYFKRMDEHRILERLLEMKMSGRRPMGRPRT